LHKKGNCRKGDLGKMKKTKCFMVTDVMWIQSNTLAEIQKPKGCIGFFMVYDNIDDAMAACNNDNKKIFEIEFAKKGNIVKKERDSSYYFVKKWTSYTENDLLKEVRSRFPNAEFNTDLKSIHYVDDDGRNRIVCLVKKIDCVFLARHLKKRVSPPFEVKE
jgi:hypothetical protein